MQTRWLTLLLLGAAAAWAQKYTGPKPPKPDVVYLVHADNLVPLEMTEAKQESKKDETVYTVAGASSPARTPLAEPIFLIQSDKVRPDRLELYRMDVKSGRREVSVSKSKRRGGPRPFRLSVTKLDGNLYRVEASEALENGQYSLSPSDSNAVFCFEVY
jgi:hypothetical protein